MLHLLQLSLHLLVQLLDQVQQTLQVQLALLLEEVVHFMLRLVFTMFVVSLLVVQRRLLFLISMIIHHHIVLVSQ